MQSGEKTMSELRMPDINSVIIVGNLIKDPTYRQTTTGVPVANFTIASNRKFKDNTGSIKEDVCFIGVVAWYKLAESCYENLKKGSAILVEGELQSRSWKTEDGFNRNTIEIKARRIQFLNKRDSHSDESVYEIHENGHDEPHHGDLDNEPHSDKDFSFGYRDIKI